MAKYLSALRAKVRQVLRDEFAPDIELEWESDELDILIGDCLEEISESLPYISREVLTTIANSRVLDISGIENLIEIKKAEYPTGNNPRDSRNVIELDSETVEIDTTLLPKAGGSGLLTGTVTFNKGGIAITGIGTLFTDELKGGYHIRKSGSNRWYRVYSIESNIALTLAEPCLDDGADGDHSTEYCYETVYLYCKKSHQLTEDESTLTPKIEHLLVLGVAGQAAINKARTLIDKINIGGARTPADMQSWGVSKLALFRQGLAEEVEPEAYQDYPKS